MDWPAGPERPAAPDGEVHVWRAAQDEADSRLALRNVLSRYLDADPAAIRLTTGPHGKPGLADDRRLEFNLSHSGELVLVAVSGDREVGIDVERIEPGRDFLAIAARALGPGAVATLQAVDGAARADAFYDLWVRREALLKCHGGGLAGPEPEGPVAVSALPVGGGYAAALAVAGPGATPSRCFSLPPG